MNSGYQNDFLNLDYIERNAGGGGYDVWYDKTVFTLGNYI